MSERGLVVLKTAFTDQEKAETVASLLVDAGLAVSACVEGKVLVFYKNEGKVQKVQEIPVTFHVLPVRVDLFLGELKLQHPDTQPKILGWPAPHVDKGTLDWATGKSL